VDMAAGQKRALELVLEQVEVAGMAAGQKIV
jgi:hypothetical protein